MSYKMILRLCGCCGGAVDSIMSAFTQLHRSGFSVSQSGKWLLIYGREKAKQVASSKIALLLFSSNVKIRLDCKERVLAKLIAYS